MTRYSNVLVILLLLMGILSFGDASFDPIQIMCEINGYMIPAIVDTGAEISVMSAECAKRCRISNRVDTKFAGKAIGVGSSDILGGIDNLPIRIGPINFQNKVSVLRNSRCDVLIGLDVLRRFKCDISLVERVLKLKVKNNVIRIPMVSTKNVNLFGNQIQQDPMLVYASCNTMRVAEPDAIIEALTSSVEFGGMVENGTEDNASYSNHGNRHEVSDFSECGAESVSMEGI